VRKTDQIRHFFDMTGGSVHLIAILNQTTGNGLTHTGRSAGDQRGFLFLSKHRHLNQ
jgi:hypothetical protein